MKPLTISMWNIQGIRSSLYGPKYNSKHFLENTIDFDFLILQETWCRTDTDIHCPPNYTEILVPSVKNPGIKRGRDSGGIIIWHKSEISKHTTIVNSDHSIIWIEISKNRHRQSFLSMHGIYSPHRLSLLQRGNIPQPPHPDLQVSGTGKCADLW